MRNLNLTESVSSLLTTYKTKDWTIHGIVATSYYIKDA